MLTSVFDIFTVGIGPSSSHTSGPMRAALAFADGLRTAGVLSGVARLHVELYGSLGATGEGHGTLPAILAGLEGQLPELVRAEDVAGRSSRIARTGALRLLGEHEIYFSSYDDVIMHQRECLPRHPNAMLFRAYDAGGVELAHRIFYSIGGGTLVEEADATGEAPLQGKKAPPYPFTSAAGLLELCHQHELSVSQLMLANETTWCAEADLRARLLGLWRVMRECIERGCRTEGVLPGGLGVRRRAPEFLRSLLATRAHGLYSQIERVSLYALAVAEENAAGGRVVTAPTNGAAGIVPAVLQYYQRTSPVDDTDGVVEFLLAAGAIGMLFRRNASISGAEVGCQGEIGVAASMAAGGLTEVLGGTPMQVETAAEIAMEHHLGLTCDPVDGLVQVPCIERNAAGAVTAITATTLAMHSDGRHVVPLDSVIRTMYETGRDMDCRYKETSRGGLAANVTGLPVSITDC